MNVMGASKRLAPPADARTRARYDHWCFFAMMELDANTLYVIRKHEDLHALYGEAPAALDEARKGFARQAQAAATRLGDSGPYLLGDTFSGADILFTTCLNGANRRKVDLPARLLDYLESGLGTMHTFCGKECEQGPAPRLKYLIMLVIFSPPDF